MRHLVARMQPESSYINGLAKTERLEKPSKIKGLAYPCNNAPPEQNVRTAAVVLILQPRFGRSARQEVPSMTDVNEAEGWAKGLDELAGGVAPGVGGGGPRRRLLAHPRGLLAPSGRKDGWQLAEAAGDRAPDGMRDFLSRVRWDAEAVRDDLRAYVVERLGDPDAVLVLDEAGFVKKGERSVGVRQRHRG